jgi:hypothetical protein
MAFYRLGLFRKAVLPKEAIARPDFLVILNEVKDL